MPRRPHHLRRGEPGPSRGSPAAAGASDCFEGGRPHQATPRRDNPRQTRLSHQPRPPRRVGQHRARWRCAGISTHTQDPPDGVDRRDEEARPTGLPPRRSAMVDDRPAHSANHAEGDKNQRIGPTASTHRYTQLSITGWQDALYSETSPFCAHRSRGLVQAARTVGMLTAKVVGAFKWDRHPETEQIDELVQRRVIPSECRAEHLRDGQDHAGRNRRELHCRNARTLLRLLRTHHREPRPQFRRTRSTRHPVRDPELDRLQFQVHFHALGDRAVREALDAIEAARHANGMNDTDPPGAPAGRPPRRHPTLPPTGRYGQHSAAVGGPRTPDGRVDNPLPWHRPL